MKMEDYLKEVEFAIIPILKAIWHEDAELQFAQTRYRELIKKVIEQDKTTQMLGKNMFASKDIKALDLAGNENKTLKQRIATRHFAIAALSGALLQFAKQGISIVHSGLDNCPSGPFIGSQPLKEILWNARNQSFHWEEKKLNPKVKNCFRNLSIEFGFTSFGMFHSSNMAYSVIKLLGWKTSEDFKAIMLCLR